jgi:hypothetical protein
MTMSRATCRIAGTFAMLALAVVACPARASAEPRTPPTPVVSVEVPLFTGQYDTGAANDRATQRGYFGLYREGLVLCNGSFHLLPSPSETLGVGPFTLQGYVWVGPQLASSNQTLGTEVRNLVGAGNNHRSNATATADPTGLPPCPEQDPDALND